MFIRNHWGTSMSWSSIWLKRGHLCAQNYRNIMWFDKVIAKIKCAFFAPQCRILRPSEYWYINDGTLRFILFDPEICPFQQHVLAKAALNALINHLIFIFMCTYCTNFILINNKHEISWYVTAFRSEVSASEKIRNDNVVVPQLSKLGEGQVWWGGLGNFGAVTPPPFQSWTARAWAWAFRRMRTPALAWMASNEWLIMAMSMLVRTMMMATW